MLTHRRRAIIGIVFVAATVVATIYSVSHRKGAADTVRSLVPVDSRSSHRPDFGSETRLTLEQALKAAEGNASLRKQAYLDFIKKGIPPEESKQVFDAIFSDFGPGAVRCELLNEFFYESNSSILDDLGLMRGDLSDSERESANMGIACRIGLRGGSVDIRGLSESGMALSLYEINLVASGLSLRVDPAFSARIFGRQPSDASFSQQDKDRYFNEGFKELSALIKSQNPESVTSIYSGFFENTARSAPFEVWKKFSDLSGIHPEIGESKSLLKNILASMVGQDPELAMTILLDAKVASSADKIGSNTSMAFDSWLKSDSRAALEWLEANTSTIGSTRIDGCNDAKATYYLRSDSFEEARKVANSITDPAIKSKVEGRIWTAERDTVRKEAGKDPAGTVQAIVSGRSKYADHWIEEAMGTWVSKDFNKAQEWYQENWKSLPAEKSQYVAAAFATQAMGQGDTATARQWASYIRNAKTKQRIEAAIAKAEGQNGN